MDMLTAAVYRKSVRNFLDRDIEKDALEKIKKCIENCPVLKDDIVVRIEITKKDKVNEEIKNNAGYNGFWIDAPYYIVVFSQNKPGFIENAGFLGESVILNLTAMGLDSCWITLKQEFVTDFNGEDMHAVALIAIGYGEKYRHRRVFNKMIWGRGYKNLELQDMETDNQIRMDIREMVYCGDYGNIIDEDFLLNSGYAEGFYAARLAPSALNRQPWRFILDKETVVLVIKKVEYSNIYEEKLAAGAVMCNFASVVGERIMPVKWIMDEPLKKYSIPNDCVIAAYCVM